MSAHLAPCPACSRHVRVSEHACPFCGEALPAALRTVQPPRPQARVKRAVLYASAFALTTGCGGATSATPDGAPADALAVSDAPHDAPGVSDGTADAPGDAGTPEDALPPPRDASEDHPFIVPPYGTPGLGGPPFDGGGRVDGEGDR